MIRTYKFHVKDKQFKSMVTEYIYKYRHFENMYLILLNEVYKKNSKDFDVLLNYKVMRSIFRGTEPDNIKEDINYIRSKYNKNQLFVDMVNSTKSLKIHNLVMIMMKVNSEYKGYDTKLKQGKDKSKPPKAKKLTSLTHYTIPLNNDRSVSLKKRDQLGINLNDKMIRTYINHRALEEVIGDFKHIRTVDVNFSNNEVYLLFIYEVKEAVLTNEEYKCAGIDIGINNLAAIYIDDKDSPSIIIDGKPFKIYNSNFNRLIAKLNRDISTLNDEHVINYLSRFRSFLYEKRNRYYYDQFHKISKRILEYLKKFRVTELILSRNLNFLKVNGKCKLKKSTKQSFIQIPFGRLLKYLELKAQQYNIEVKFVDESYTSKVSSISQDISKIQELTKEELQSINCFGGKRVKRGLYIDNKYNKALNSDLNAARNICILGSKQLVQTEVNSYLLRKLCNPIKIESDFELCRFLESR